MLETYRTDGELPCTHDHRRLAAGSIVHHCLIRAVTSCRSRSTQIPSVPTINGLRAGTNHFRCGTALRPSDAMALRCHRVATGPDSRRMTASSPHLPRAAEPGCTLPALRRAPGARAQLSDVRRIAALVVQASGSRSKTRSVPALMLDWMGAKCVVRVSDPAADADG